MSDKRGYLNTVASWHHSEWLKGRTGASDPGYQENFSKRIAALELHCESTSIPCTFVAVCDEQVVGSASIVYYQFTKKHKRTEWLTNVYVHPDYRQRGIGEKLIRHTCHHAAEHGVAKMMLYTRDRSEFYKKRGWHITGEGVVQGNDVVILSMPLNELKQKQRHMQNV